MHAVQSFHPEKRKPQITLTFTPRMRICRWRVQPVPGAIWTLQPDSCCILLICSPPRPITEERRWGLKKKVWYTVRVKIKLGYTHWVPPYCLEHCTPLWWRWVWCHDYRRDTKVGGKSNKSDNSKVRLIHSHLRGTRSHLCCARAASCAPIAEWENKAGERFRITNGLMWRTQTPTVDCRSQITMHATVRWTHTALWLTPSHSEQPAS